MTERAPHRSVGARALVLAAEAAGALERAIAILRDGETVGVPTETVYGLACLARAESLERLVALKGRAPDKGLALLVDSPEQLEAWAIVPPLAARLARHLWPGPLTLVLQVRPGATLPTLVTGGLGTVAFRLPAHEIPRALARALGPLALTSANRSGQPEATTAAQLVAALPAGVPLVLDAGPSAGGVPSTVVRVGVEDEVPVMLRAGALAWQEIERAAN